jgi:hypothetical protein
VQTTKKLVNIIEKGNYFKLTIREDERKCSKEWDIATGDNEN